MKKLLLSAFFALLCCCIVFGQDNKSKSDKPSGIGNGIGTGLPANKLPEINDSTLNQSLRILAKPRANYTDAARQNGIEGFVTLRVTFLASGQIGSISLASALPFGLTEQAVAAARNLRFIPAIKNGQYINVVKLVQYVFTIYYKEDDKIVEKKAEILEMPAFEYPQGDNLKSVRGKVKIEIVLGSNGTASVLRFETNLPKEYEQKAVEAVSKIKFKPAIHKNGKEISVTRVIEYELKSQN